MDQVVFAKLSFKEKRRVHRIVNRALPLFEWERKAGVDKYTWIEMDLCAAHHTCPLDFEKLLAFDDFSFSHDIYGIFNCLNRETGKLERNFLPRCAKPQSKRSKA